MADKKRATLDVLGREGRGGEGGVGWRDQGLKYTVKFYLQLNLNFVSENSARLQQYNYKSSVFLCSLSENVC